MSNKTLIIIPVYNEEKTIKKTIIEIKKCIVEHNLNNEIDILAIDDCSTDASPHIIKDLKINSIRNIRNLGYGSSLQIGYRYAVENNYKYVIQMDADGQHSPSSVLDLCNKIKEPNVDLVIGNRFTNSKIKISKIKRLAIKYFSLLIKISSGITIKDPTSGMQAMKNSVAYYYSKFNQFDSMFPDANIVLEAAKAGFKITEIPARMYDRKGKSKIFTGLKPIIYMFYVTIATVSVNFKKDVKSRYLNAINFATKEEQNEQL